MKMKKISIFTIILVIIFGLFCFGLGKITNEEVYEEENIVPKATHKEMLSMMLEQNAGKGDYSLETRSTWPTKEDGYVFNSTLSKCEKGSQLRWDDENNAVVMVGTTSDKCYVYFDIYNPPFLIADVCSSGGNLAGCVKKLYQESNSDLTNIYYHDYSLENGANDNSYRYAGSSDTTNNFACFGSDESTCPDDNLYRIIGMFGDKVKLIKWDYANSDLLGTDGDYNSNNTYSTSNFSNYKGFKVTVSTYYWTWKNSGASYTANGHYNDWSYSELNKTNLNTNYLTNIGARWSSKIDVTKWKVGGNTYDNLYRSNAKTAYINEIISPSDEVESLYQSKIGLMYVSDYYYAASPTYWTYPGYNSNDSSKDYRAATRENWMYIGIFEWTITRGSQECLTAGDIYDSGYAESNFDVYTYSLGVRPVFYLNSDVTYVSGSGTKSDPIKIN